jgi:glucan phosphoethanolaminetransferase (alkaline phosphatase superfamily)
MLIVLMVAAIVSIVVEYFFGEDKSKFWIEGVSILFAVGICSIVATANDYQKNKQFAELD